MTINTKHVARRELRFASLDELSAELDRLEAAHHAGTLAWTGNWTPGQNFQHLARFMTCSIDGFPPGKPPLLMRTIIRLIAKRPATRGMRPPAGIKLPKQAAFFLPDPEVAFEDGLAELRGCLDRVGSGERFVAPSPVFGRLTHTQWTNLHLGHSALHLGFLHPDGAPEGGGE
ncbi:MAG: DUF1569 domain-containing protein [Phycisphaeraceae bacterium]|nr:DUF1569 domain-containing protein [Phycisphaeraceae bacterium]